MLNILQKVLAEGNGVPVREGLKEAGVQSYEPTNPAESGTYKAQSPGKLARHNKAQDSGDLPTGRQVG